MKDKNKRLLLKKQEIKRLSFKIGLRFKKKLKLNSITKLAYLSKNSSLSKIHNKCFITERSHGICKGLKISRIKLREISLNGLSVGFTKASW
jgi:small subunit ribosomal protein S14